MDALNTDAALKTLKICAESQLDDPSTRFAAVTAAWQYVKDGTTIKDVDALDLLEWACQDHLPECDFADTLGTLRMRAVKAGLKNQNEAIRCLESCLLHWDLVNAQQVGRPQSRLVSTQKLTFSRLPPQWTDPILKSGSSCSGTLPSHICSL